MRSSAPDAGLATQCLLYKAQKSILGCQACLQVDKGGSTRAQCPPPEVSREELYQFKMQNYIFCPVESSLMPASLSMDGKEVRKEDSRRRDEESGEDYYEDDYLPEEDRLVLGSQRQNDDDGEGLVGEEVDADDPHQHQGGQHQQRVLLDPAQQQHGMLQGAGQAGETADDGHVGTGQQKTKDSESSSQKKKLLIKIKPEKWGFPDPKQQNSPASLKSFKN